MSTSLLSSQCGDGLYDPKFEKSACGVGVVADIGGVASHDIVVKALTVLTNLEHRSASGADPEVSDGAGIMVNIGDSFFRKVADRQKIKLPSHYGVGMVFLPHNGDLRKLCQDAVAEAVHAVGLTLCGWRDVPTEARLLGPTGVPDMPVVRQFFVGGTDGGDGFERLLYVARKKVERAAERILAGTQLRRNDIFYICSLSGRTIVYKGMVMPSRLGDFYRDLQDDDFASCFGLVHSRFSTNTLGAWNLAHPYRMLAHNGEINTIRGNRNWMKVRETALSNEVFGKHTADILPVCREATSDTAALDNTFELLRLAGRPIEHVSAMLQPVAWYGNRQIEPAVRDFYEYHGALTEPWDGPAMVAFSDGLRLGATLDRNGLRPFRYRVTKDNLLVMGSETGVLESEPSNIAKLDWVAPGRLFLVDFNEQRIVPYEELITKLSNKQPYGKWLVANRVLETDLEHADAPTTDFNTLVERQVAFGYTQEDHKVLLEPMAQSGAQPVGSMGNDTPLAVLSEKPQLLPSYFKQLFAQVSNPPLDPIREKLVTQLAVPVGRRGDIFEETEEHCRNLRVDDPILLNENMARIKNGGHPHIKPRVISTLVRVADGTEGYKKAVNRIRSEAVKAATDGCNIVILSDRGVDADHTYISPLLATATVHHHLIRQNKRLALDIVVESGEPREVHHFATLFGYGASAINPYLALECLDGIAHRHELNGANPHPDTTEAHTKYRQAAQLGVLKTISKMGVSTLQGYIGAQQFEAIGLSQEFVDEHFTWTATRLEGIGIEEIAQDAFLNHRRAFPEHDIAANLKLDIGGLYFWRGTGEHHEWNPQSIALLQEAATLNDRQKFDAFEEICDNPPNTTTLRSLMEFNPPADGGIALQEVEPATEIVKRFATGGISLGSISREAHETMAIAMNRIGARSNSGEGGEDAVRYKPDPNGDSRSSAVKQVASGRFGVTANYLVNARDIQIKMAQGAKPGEGGEIPGHKVDDYIGRIRRTNPGVELISPPPQHDIYSIEDLAQLIHDLKNVNPAARIHVKLVSEVGVGIIAAGVAKGKGDVVLIAGHSGGTGASPLSSIRHAGLPWELGVAETHQVLTANRLRDRIVVQADGQMRTARDVVVAALLGAEEWGIGTASLVTLGCIMLRKCHLNTCSVGIATQDPRLRAKFAGQPEALVNYFMMLAESVREYMAKLGFRTVNEMIGRADMLKQKTTSANPKTTKIRLDKILKFATPADDDANHNRREQDHGIDKALDNTLIELAEPALTDKTAVSHKLPIRNTNRTVGAMLSGRIAKKYGEDGLPDGTVRFEFNGSAGLSFGAFAVKGVELRLNGDANDYFGKGLSGGRLIVKPFTGSDLIADQNAAIGNVALYGATGGEVYVSGRGGERFCVRNSAATAVIEGVGDHCCEYMTGGCVVVLGATGRNFGAGMSDGIAYVYDPEDGFDALTNTTMVGSESLTADSEHEQQVKDLVQKHLDYTGSPKAAAILTDWERTRTAFKVVTPLAQRKKQKTALAGAQK